jgi:hypothetical protein
MFDHPDKMDEEPGAPEQALAKDLCVRSSQSVGI